ncbi:MAG: hypothetical protein ACM3UR_10845, partial [Bacteroidota bacterium]
VSPIEDTPGRRDYEWSVDTIKSQMLSLSRIWASSPSDVWVSGEDGDYDKMLWHYDGHSWQAAGLWGLAPYCIFGFSRADIYTGGFSIFHYSGSSWKEMFIPKVDSLSYWSILLPDIRGISPDNIWAVGFGYRDQHTSYGVIYHFDGKRWQQSMVMKKKNIDLYRVFPTGEGNKCLIYAVKNRADTFPDSTVIYEYDGNSTLKEIATGPFWEMENQTMIYTINGDLFVEMKNMIYEYSYGQYRRFMSAKTLNGGEIMGGRSRSDFFVWQPGELQHFNGSDLKTIFRLKNDVWLLDDVIAFEKEIFFFAQDNVTGDHYLVKGKLKE